MLIAASSFLSVFVIVYLYLSYINLKRSYNSKDEQIDSLSKIIINLEYSLNESISDRNILNNNLINLTSELQDTTEKLHQSLLERHKAGKEAIIKAKAVIKGFDGETFAPWIIADGEQALSPRDFRHLGDPIDYIIFDGVNDVHGNRQDDISRIILLDIKTGHSDLTKVQRRIRDAVINGKVEFAVFNPQDNTFKTYQNIFLSKQSESND